MQQTPSNYQGMKVRVTITACDPTQRLIHGRFKDGGSTSIAVFEIGQAFRWPQVGEVWTVTKQNNYWILGSRLNNDQYEIFPVTTLSGVSMRLDGSPVYDLQGNQLVSTQIGDMKLTATTNTQTNWLLCNGASYPTTLYSDLFSSIQYTYGGSGANFNVPTLTVSGGPTWLIFAGS